MHKNTVAITLTVLVLLGIGFFGFTRKSNAPSKVTATEIATTTTATSSTPKEDIKPTSPAPSPTFTTADVAAHNSESSCYTIISGSVYDLTKWIGQHPGGERAILSICGHDGTQAFMNQHHGAQRQEDILVTFKIGTLKK